jgi:hypothetical protein
MEPECNNKRVCYDPEPQDRYIRSINFPMAPEYLPALV